MYKTKKKLKEGNNKKEIGKGGMANDKLGELLTAAVPEQKEIITVKIIIDREKRKHGCIQDMCLFQVREVTQCKQRQQAAGTLYSLPSPYLTW